MHVHVVPVDALAHTEVGPQRGYAHVGTATYPASAPGRLDFGSLRMVAIGELRPGEGFDMHTHANVENLMLMTEGRLRHEDELGNHCDVGPTDLYHLSAGSGMRHAERVAGAETVRGVVIWIEPTERDTPPTFQVATAPRARRRDRLVVLASGRADAPPGAMVIGSDASVCSAVLSPGAAVAHGLEPGRLAYVVSLEGAIEVAGQRAAAGDRVLVDGAEALTLRALEATEVVIVDLAGGPTPLG